MAIDYSEFLARNANGTIWWPVETAAKLAAGFEPTDCAKEPDAPALRPTGNASQTEVRNILAYLALPAPLVPHPLIVEAEGQRVVRADEFLDWLDRIAEAHSTPSAVPPALKVAVQKARLQAAPGAGAAFASLRQALDGKFGLQLGQLPLSLAERVVDDFRPVTWNMLSPEQRQWRATEWDYLHDPATEPERTKAFDLFSREYDLEADIRRWELVAAPTAQDLATKEARLTALRRELIELQTLQRDLEERERHYLREGRQKPKWRERLEAEQFADIREGDPRPAFVPYMKAMAALRERWKATPEELAAWIFMTPKDGGIAAYRNANEFDDPPRFYFDSSGEGAFDLLDGLMATWYRADDLAQFAPTDRFITGAALRARWASLPGIRVDAFVRAKIEESRLTAFHPCYGATRWDHSQDDGWPPEDLALFALSEVEAIEREDLGIEPRDNVPRSQPEAPSDGTERVNGEAGGQAMREDSHIADRNEGGKRPDESAEERARRLFERHLELKAANTRNPTGQVAQEERVSVGRVRQLIGPLRRAAREQKASPFPFVPPKKTD